MFNTIHDASAVSALQSMTQHMNFELLGYSADATVFGHVRGHLTWQQGGGISMQLLMQVRDAGLEP